MQTARDHELADAYTKIFTSFDPSRFRPVDTGLAGIFLPSASAGPVKLMDRGAGDARLAGQLREGL